MEAKPKTPTEEIDRLFKIADQQASAHSFLHQAYHIAYMLMSIAVLLMSTFTLMLSLASDDFIKTILHVLPDYYKWYIAIAAFTTSSITLIDLFWRPSEKSRLHETALKHNSNTKDEIRRLKSAGGTVTQEDFARIQQIHQGLKDGPLVPEILFLPLKARHHRKVRLSASLDKHAYVPIWLMRLRFLYLDVLQFWKKSGESLLPPPEPASSEPGQGG